MDFKLKIEDKNNLLNTFKSAPTIASKEFGDSLERVAVQVVNYAQHNAPVGRYRGGTLRQSIKYRRNFGNSVTVYVGADYGVYVDQGTRPHVILPKNGKILMWKDGGGNTVVARRVNHPGTRATNFFGDAVKDGETYANKEFKVAMDRVAERIARGG